MTSISWVQLKKLINFRKIIFYFIKLTVKVVDEVSVKINQKNVLHPICQSNVAGWLQYTEEYSGRRNFDYDQNKKNVVTEVGYLI